MAIFSVFVGIDRFSDPTVDELSGARRDALALWALFGDTLPDDSHQSKLLTDDGASLEAIRTALDATLGAAGADDVVILSFATHGTPNHRLVFHDTARARLEETTMAMAELASRFKSTRARAVLCILDCCFSGAAPARVLDDSPVTRDVGVPLAALAGTGRILIAACGETEEALEDPHSRHGLLTQAVIDAFRSGEGGSISLTTAMDVVLGRVRGEAARQGYTQNPVMLGHVEGGLTFPVLRPGTKFFQAFPERRRSALTGPIEGLADFGIAGPVIAAWKNAFVGGLNPLQLQAINDYGILDGSSLLVVAPTSSGKTFLGEMAAARAVAEGRKAVFLFPYRALVNEKFDQFGQLYGSQLGLRVVRCTGDYQDGVSSFPRGRYDIALLTYEMFLHLVLSYPATLNRIGLVVVDEAQFITDDRRGITVELLLTYLLLARRRGVTPQLLALSAVIGDIGGFDQWLGCRSLVTGERPVPLSEGVLDRSGVLMELDSAGQQHVSQFLPGRTIIQRGSKPSAQDVIVPLVQQLIRSNVRERIIVFRNQRGPAEGCAAYLARDVRLPPATSALAALPEHDLSITATKLRECLAGGTAFHNANLNREEREVVERTFRDVAGEVRVLAATTTVAAGINTPASTVILAEQEFIGEDGRAFTVAEYKNMAGRAGRLGFQEVGRAIILADNAHERHKLFARYVLGRLDSLRSSFNAGQMETWVLRLLAQVKRVERSAIFQLLANTFGGYVSGLAQPNWAQVVEARLQPILDQMSFLGLTEEEAGIIRLTLLGQACGRSSLSFASITRLLTLLKTFQSRPFTAESLMVLLQALPDADDIYTPVMKKGQSEARWQQEVGRRYGLEVARALQRQAADVPAYWARCKRVMVLTAYIDGTPMEIIETTFTANPYQGKIGAGDVRRFADATRYHLLLAHQIVSLLLVEEAPPGTEIDSLLRRLEIGLPTTALDLLNLPAALSRGEYLNLVRAGIDTTTEFWLAPEEILQSALGTARTNEILSRR